MIVAKTRIRLLKSPDHCTIALSASSRSSLANQYEKRNLTSLLLAQTTWWTTALYRVDRPLIDRHRLGRRTPPCEYTAQNITSRSVQFDISSVHDHPRIGIDTHQSTLLGPIQHLDAAIVRKAVCPNWLSAGGSIAGRFSESPHRHVQHDICGGDAN